MHSNHLGYDTLSMGKWFLKECVFTIKAEHLTEFLGHHDTLAHSIILRPSDLTYNIIKDSNQVPRNKSPKIFHQNIRGLGNKANELYCHLHHDLPHILCLSQHHLSESEVQLTHLANYSLGVSCCRKTYLKGSVSIFVYRNLKYNTINIDEYDIEKDIEVCAIQLD